MLQGKKWLKVPIEIMLCSHLLFSGLNIMFEILNLPRDQMQMVM